jgi:predicted amidophosphoribosyltransferase
MSLIKCPACGRDVSKNAPSCPGCGEPIKSSVEKASGAINMKDPVHLIGVIFAIAVLLGIILLFVNGYNM